MDCKITIEFQGRTPEQHSDVNLKSTFDLNCVQFSNERLQFIMENIPRVFELKWKEAAQIAKGAELLDR